MWRNVKLRIELGQDSERAEKGFKQLREKLDAQMTAIAMTQEIFIEKLKTSGLTIEQILAIPRR